MSANKPKDDLIGKTLKGQYEILEEVGRGGMATVYRARQKSMNRIVAVKVLPRHFLHDPGFYERFEREVDVISHLEHPHILPIYDYGQDESVPYIVMRFLGGGSMEQLIRRGKSIVEDLEKPIRQIALALDYAHQQGIIHRDLKPGNIMLDEAGNAYLSDFGIARVLGSELTGSMIVGTPAYMSPEQANGFPIDARSDIYALGVVMFELITGREPYQAETPMAVLLKHINEPMPPITQYRDDIPNAIEDVIIKATAKNPKDRFASAGDLAKAFSAAIKGDTASFDPPPRSVPTQKSPTPDRLPAVSEPIASEAPTPIGLNPVTQPAPAPRRSPIGLIVGAVVLVALVAAAALVAPGLLDQSDPTPVPTIDANAVPTPFFNATTVDGALYTISIPRTWIPPEGLTDRSDTNRLIHIWGDPGQDAYVALVMVDTGLMGAAEFQDAVADYQQRYYATNPGITLIDESEAEDGTIRQSYRYNGGGAAGGLGAPRPGQPGQLPQNGQSTPGQPPQNGQQNGPSFAPGQTDVYFLQRGSYLVILEMYGADETANTLIPTFQNILDSVRVKVNPS
jgi:serine/threonine protein kinase